MKKKRKLGRNLLSFLLTLAMVFSTMTGIVPFMDTSMTVKAEVADKTVAGLGTSAIGNPTSTESSATAWAGSYVYYGKYDGENPTKYRVLDTASADFGVDGGSLLLDCDKILYASAFYNNNSNVWSSSLLIRSGLQGDKFLNKQDVFTVLEKSAIASSTKASSVEKDGAGASFLKYVALESDTVFILDAKEASRASYGYASNGTRIKDGNTNGWWLRSTQDGNVTGYVYSTDGYYGPAGTISSGNGGITRSVSPAFNIGLSSVIFASEISSEPGSYKLTLKDDALGIAVTEGEKVEKSGNTLTIPYTVSGENSANATQVSVLVTGDSILDESGNIIPAKMTATNKKAYGKLVTEGSFAKSGTGAFELPSDLTGTIGTDYHVYLLAEDVNGEKETDYANLKEITADDISTGPDKTALNDAITAAVTLYDSIKNNNDYSDIAATLSTAIDAAKEVAGSDTADQDAIDAATTAITTAKTNAEAAKKDVDDTTEANKVSDLIEDLPAKEAVTKDNKEAIEAARAAYNALTDDQKEKVDADTLKKLTDAETALAAFPEILDSTSTTWTKNATITDNLTIDDKVTVTADITLTIPEGKTLTVNGGIDAGEYTVTVAGKGVLVVTGTNGTEGTNGTSNGGAGSDGFKGNIIVDGATVTVTGGNGGNVTGNNFPTRGSNGGNGGNGVAGNITVNSGSATVTGGNGGTGGKGRAPGRSGSTGIAVTGTITGPTVEESADNSTWTKIESGASSTKKYIKVSKATAEVVKSKIDALPNADEVTIEDKTDIQKARDAYDALDDTEKDKIEADTRKKLTDAESALAVAEVSAAINALPAATDVTTANKEAIEAARAAYEALTDEQKAKVSADTLKKLTDDESALAVAEVSAAINALPAATDVTTANKEAIEAARAAYEALTDEQKAKVSADTLKKLTDDESALAVAEVSAAINALPAATDVTTADKEAIKAARAAYDALTNDQKAKISDDKLKKLADAEDKLAVLLAMSEVSAKTGSSVIYTGDPIQLINTPTTALPTGYTMKYAVTTENVKPTDEKLYTTDIPTETDAGTYYVWYKVVGNENYNDCEAVCVKVTIEEEKKQDEPETPEKPEEPVTPDIPVKTVDMYRLYNPNSGEHFYTANVTEKDNLVKLGWRYEGIGWKAPVKSNTPVYRLYNPNAGDHHFTRSIDERDRLVSLGWKYEGIGWYSDDAESVPLYRQYNPNAKSGTHNYTASKSENDWLVSLGWKGEGIGWYGVK